LVFRVSPLRGFVFRAKMAPTAAAVGYVLSSLTGLRCDER
jgi:hypothetical protein